MKKYIGSVMGLSSHDAADVFLHRFHMVRGYDQRSLLDGVGDDFGDILDLHLIFGLDTFDAVFEHGDAEGAGGGQHLGLCLQSLVDTGLVDALADLLLHPDAPTTTAAAEALVAMATHFCHAVAVQYTEDATWLVVDIVVASDVAGIVIGELTFVEAFGQLELVGGHQRVDEDGVMDYLIVATQLWIFILNGIETVWAGRDNGAMLCGNRR